MHAVVTHVTVNDAEGATAALREQIVPRVSQAPGFVAGYWVRLPDDRGVSVVVFESEDAAKTTAQQVQSGGPPNDAVTFDRVEVGEIVANA